MNRSRGFASFHALVIMVFATLAGAYLLRSASKDAGTASGYFQMRTAASSAQAGLVSGLAQLESDTAAAQSLIKNYLANHNHQWLLGDPVDNTSATTVALSGTGQSFSARILAFDTATGLIKIMAEGNAPGGSVSRVYGIYRLEGFQDQAPVGPSDHALFVAGDGRNVDVPLVVNGSTYFGGGVNFRAGSAGSAFNGPFKAAARLAASPTVFQAGATFNGPAFFETSTQFQSGTVNFLKSVGFDDDVILGGTTRVTGTGLTAYANGLLSGSQRLDMGGDVFLHSGYADPAHVTNASLIKDNQSPISIADALGLPGGTEDGISVDFSSIPASKMLKSSAMGLVGNVTGKNIFDAWHATDDYYKMGPGSKYIIVNVDQPISFVRGPDSTDNVCFKWVVWIVKSPITVNGNLFETVICDYGALAGNWGNMMFYVPSGGTIAGFGGNGLFRGYIHVTGNGSVTYQWGPGGHMAGAIHHVSETSGFGLIGPNAMKVDYDASIMNEFAGIGILNIPSSAPAAPTGEFLTDAKVRPRLVGIYY